MLWSRQLEKIAEKVRPQLPRVALGLIAACCLYQTLCHTEVFVDDAAISFSYSRQLVEQGELVHTASSERVEGFSNPTWTLLCAIPFLLHMDPYIFARALGLLMLLSGLWLVWRTACLLCPRSPAAQLVAPLFYGLAPSVGFWTLAGLETPLVSFLLALVVYQTVREELEDAPPCSGLLLALLALTRPEGVMYAAPIAFYKLLRRWRHEKPAATERSHHLTNLILLATPVVAYFLWRRFYFDAWVPNTYFTKTSALEILQPEQGFAARGLRYLFTFLGVYRLWPLFIAAPFAAAVRRRWAEGLLILSLVAAHLSFVLWANGDWMGDFRFFAMAMPIYALLLALVVQGIGEVIARFGGRDEEARRHRVAAGLGRLAAGALVLLYIVFALLPTLANYGRSGWVSMALVRHQGRMLEIVARERGLLQASIAVPDVGGSGLGANVHVLDTVGLVDRVMARHKGQPGRVRQYFFEEARPDFYQAHSHWTRFYNLPLHFEFDLDYVQLPESVVEEMVLLGDNYIRREHLTGWPGEAQNGTEAELGRGLVLRGWDGPTSVGEDLEVVLYIEAGGRPPGEEDRLLVDLSNGPGRESQTRTIDLSQLPTELFDAGTLLRLRVAGEAAPVTDIRVRGLEGEATDWLDVQVQRAGEADGANLERFVLHPRTHFACGATPERWLTSLEVRGRKQLFDTCRPLHRAEEVHNFSHLLHERAVKALDRGAVESAIALLGRAELLAPESEELRVTGRWAARVAHGHARQAARDGDLDRARGLCVAALRADPRFARARSLYLDLVDRGLRYSPDRRARLEAARARLGRDRSVEAQRELLVAALQADRPLDALRTLAALEIEPRGGSVAPLAARAFHAVGLCERARQVLEPADGRSCEVRRLRHISAAICGEEIPNPRCAEPNLETEEITDLFDFEVGGYEGWELSQDAAARHGRERDYISGYSGRGFLRTDRVAGGPAGELAALSPDFELTATGLSLQVGGGSEADGVSVALIVGGREVARAAGQRDLHLRRVTWDVSSWVGQRARIRVHDRGGEDSGIIMIDHVRTHPLHYFDAARQP